MASAPSPRTISDAIKQEAQQLGFVAVGITSAERFAAAEPLVVDWLRQERQGQMGWLTEERARLSCRPAELLPGARSLIVVAAPYPREPEAPPPPPLGRLARYARGRDYHQVVRARLLALIQRLEGEGLRVDLVTRVKLSLNPLASWAAWRGRDRIGPNPIATIREQER